MNRKVQKKDIHKTLKAMRVDNPSKFIEMSGSNKSGDKIKYRQLVSLYTSNSKRTQPKQLRRNLRYQREDTLLDKDDFKSKQGSLDLRRTKFMRISLKSEQKQTKSNLKPNTRQSLNQAHKLIHEKKLFGKRTYTEQNSRYQRKTQFQVPSIDDARNLQERGMYEKSQKLLEKILAVSPNNIEGLYLCGVNHFNLHNYIKCLSVLNRVVEMDAIFKENAYVFSSSSYYHLGKMEQSLKRIDTGLAFYPDSYELQYQKGTLLMQMARFDEALKILKMCLRLTKNLYYPLLKLAECYQCMNCHKLAIKLYDEIASLDNLSSKGYKCYIRKGKCLKKLQRYSEYIQTMEIYLKLCPLESVQNIAEMYFGISYAQYKLRRYSSAIMNAEEVLKEKDKQYCTKALILLTVIYVVERDFYEAWHTLSRKEHLEINQDQIKFYQLFCEGVLCLMKRKFDTGLQKLEAIQFQASDSPSGQFQTDIACLYPMYLAYAYFCQGNIKQSIQQMDKILSSPNQHLIVFKKAIQFNKLIGEGLEAHKKKNVCEGLKKFKESIQIYPEKAEGYLYAGICEIEEYLTTHNQEYLNDANFNFYKSSTNLKSLNNNYAAFVFYCKSIVSIYMENLQNSLSEIDEAIERSEDNDPQMFYLRALILAIGRDYNQALHELSIAISIDSHNPEFYLLRSKCLQIQGEGNRAFSDLQTYININPEDINIHKFAGQLLFENGAFEDALEAFNNSPIEQNIQNFDIFLTRAKTYFLVGNFSQTINDMKIASSMKSEDEGIISDIQIIDKIDKFFKYCIDRSINSSQIENQINELEKLKTIKGRIFRSAEIKVLSAMFSFHLGKYREASRYFSDAIKEKEESFMEAAEEFQEEQNQKYFFICQMYFNKSLCHLFLGEKRAALNCLSKCSFDKNSKTHAKLLQFKEILQLDQKDKGQGSTTVCFELFSQKNKMSKYLPSVEVPLQKIIIVIHLCIPFPKVQPPQITPKISSSLLRKLKIENVERKPEAPWILREDNSIKFTQKLQNFSRLQINNSQLSKMTKKSSKNHNFLLENQQLLNSTSFVRQSLSNLKKKLKFDEEIEKKLNKILKKQK